MNYEVDLEPEDLDTSGKQMSTSEKVYVALLVVWLACGLVAAGMFLESRKRCEFKASVTAAVPIIVLGGLSLICTSIWDDSTDSHQLGEDRSPHVKEIKRLRKELEAHTK